MTPRPAARHLFAAALVIASNLAYVAGWHEMAWFLTGVLVSELAGAGWVKGGA